MKYIRLSSNKINEAFQCLASSCPYSCCVGWDIPLDRRTAEAYLSVEGAFGEKLRRHIKRGDKMHIERIGGRCAFLDRENLCEIHRHLGEEQLCNTCRAYPFRPEALGRELLFITPLLSCPAVASDILSQTAPLQCDIRENADRQLSGKEGEGRESLVRTEAAYGTAISALKRMLAMSQDRQYPMDVRKASLLSFARALDAALQSVPPADAADVLDRFSGASCFSFLPHADDAAFSAALCGMQRDLPEILLLLPRLTEEPRNVAALIGEGIFYYRTHGHTDFPGDHSAEEEHLLSALLFTHFPEGFKRGRLLRAVKDSLLLSRLYFLFLPLLSAARKAVLPLSERVLILSFLFREFAHNADRMDALYQLVNGRKQNPYARDRAMRRDRGSFRPGMFYGNA